jgi:hypothetical protein
MDYRAKTLKKNLKSMPRDALQTRHLATLHGYSTEVQKYRSTEVQKYRSTEALRQCTTISNQVDLAPERVPCLCEPIRAAGFGACGHWGSGNVLV